MKKRILSMLLAIVMVVGLVPGFAVTASAAESYSYPTSNPTTTWAGSGTESDPYVITTAQQLADFAWFVNNKNSSYYSKYYKLGNDIDISGGTWEPIGYYDGSSASEYAAFKGTFDGNEKTVSGLNSVSITHKTAALFGCIENGTIKNLTVSGTYSSTATRSAGICARSTGSFYNCTNNVNITISTSSGSAYAGGIAAYCTGNIENCQNNGNLTTDTTVGTYIGGICGSFGASQTQIANCTNTGTIQGNGTNGMGGICATLANSAAVISNCTNSGNISSKSYVGGIIGKANGKVEGCTNSGNVSASTDSAGGICGYNMSSSKSKGGIVNCSNSGTISGPKNIGGISGYGESLISKCNNTGNVKSTNTGSSAQVQVGGIEGYSSNAAINNCYNTGTISGGSSSSWYVGGISGRLGDGSTIENCHSYGTVSNARTGNLNNALYYSGAIFGGSGTVTNSYYLNGTDGKATPKTSTEFSDGSVTRLLQSGNLELVWGQTIGTDTHPVFYNGSNALGVDATGITVNPTTVTVGVGKTVTLTATVTPEHANDKTVTWTSDNTSIATVVNGVVTGVSKGTAIITVTSTAGGFTATCTVTVCDHVGSTHTEYTTANCQHTYTCTLCNLTLTDECTFDAASGICSVCKEYVAVVSVTVNGSTTHYKDIISAVEYVTNLSGSDAVEMKLTADSISDATIYFPAKAITLDLNGKSATIRSLYYDSNADLTIKDNTSEQAGKLLITYQHSISEGAKLTLNSGFVEGNYQCNYVEGTFVMTGGTLKSTLNAIQVEDANSEIIISGGTLDGGQYAIYRQASYHTSKITLSGGYFINGIRSTSLSGYPLSGLLAEGYKFVDDDNNNVDATVDYLQENLRVVFDHKHEWKYSAEGATITATCANTDGACGDPEQSITIEAPYAGRGGLFFDNAVKSATISGTIEDVVLPEIVYTLKSTGEVATPLAPSVYVASIMLGTAIASCEFEIVKGTLSNSNFVYDSTTTVTYDGTAKSVSVTPKDGIAEYVGTIEVLYNGSATLPTNVGDYTISINVAESDYYTAKTIDLRSGRVNAKLTISAKDIADLTCVLEDSYPLTGGAATPDVTIRYNGMTLVKDTDYTIGYANNTTPGGTATMTVRGIGNYTGTKTMEFKISEHSHSWNYELVGTDTIKATCTAEGCPNTNGGSVTIHAPAGYTTITPLKYSGVEQKATFTGSFTTGDDFAADNAITITYDKTPINVGEYTASIEVNGAIAHVTYFIKQKPVTITANHQTIFYGESLTANYVTPDGLISGHTVAGVTLTPSSTDVGTGTITPSAAKIMNGAEDVTANYNISYEAGTLTITAKPVGGDDITVDGVNPSYTYTGQPICPDQFTVTVDGNTLGIGDYTVSYGNNTTVAEDGSVTVTLQGNYSGTKTVNFAIVKSDTDFTIGTYLGETPTTAFTYGDTITVKVSGVVPATYSLRAPDPGEMALYVKVGEDYQQISDSVSADAAGVYTLTYETANKDLKIGPNTLYAKFVSDGNMKDHMDSVPVTLKQAPLTVTVNTTGVTKVYDGTTTVVGVQQPTLTLNGVLPADKDAVSASAVYAYDTKSVGTDKIINASGITLISESINSYYSIPVTATGSGAAITAKEIGIEWSNTSLTYNGQAQKPTATAAGLVSGDICGITVTGEQTNAGENYTATATELDNPNYKLPDNASGVFSIAPKTVNTPVIELSSSSFVYDGNKKEPTVVVKDPETGDVIVTEEYTFTYSNNIDVSTAEAPAAVTITDKEGGNYTVSGTASFTISQSAASMTATTNSDSYIYGDKITVTVNVSASGNAVSYGLRITPAANQVAIYNGTTQITEPKTVENGVAEFEIDTVEAGLVPGQYALTAVYTASSNIASAEADTQQFTVSYLAVDAAASLEGTLGQNGWYTSNVTVKAPAGYSITAVLDSADTDWTTPVMVTSDGTTTVSYYLKNSSGLITGEKRIEVKRDTAAPVIGSVTVSNVTNDSAVVTVTASDMTSGMSSYALVSNDGATVTITNNGNGVFHITGMLANKVYGFTAAVTDAAGLASSDSVSVNTSMTDLSNADVAITGDYVYNGQPQVPEIIVVVDGKTLIPNEDYSMSYSNTNGGDGNHTDAGTVTVTITGKGDYCGETSVQFVIHKAGTVAAPVITPGSTQFSDSLEITITCATDGAIIYYTIDGSEPTIGSTVYTAPFMITDNTTVRSFAVKVNMDNSEKTAEIYEKKVNSGFDYDMWYWTLMMLYNQQFDITATVTEGGTITPVGVSKVKYSKDLLYIITPAEGYMIEDVIVDGKSIGAVEVYNFDNVKKDHTITAIFAEIPWQNPFKDIWETDVYYDDVKYVYENGLMLGTGDDIFSPDETLTRAMLVTILWRIAGRPIIDSPVDFFDVPADQWYSDAIAWASANGIVLGYGDGTFGTEDPITREQLAVILYRYEQYLGGGFTGMWMFPLRYTDAEDVADWAYEAICWLTMKDIYVTNEGTLLDPGEKATRAETAAFLCRFCEYHAEEDGSN